MSTIFAAGMRFLLVSALVARAPYPLAAQQDSQQPPILQATQSSDIVFHSSVRRVVLDVVATGSNEKPIRGLSRNDFSIKEDGKPQQILSFDAHEFDEISEPLPNSPALPSNTWINVPPVPEKGPLYVILYDMVNMDIDDQATARKQLLKFIRDKPPGARFAIYVFSDGLRLVQGFTADPTRLFAAMDPSSPQPHVPRVFLHGDNYGRGQVGPIVSVLTKIAHFLDGFPERKNVIWVTGAVPTVILSAGSTGPNSDSVSYGDEIKEAINAMARSQIAVYPVDIRGVVITHIQARPQAGGGGSAMTTTSDSTALNADYSTEADIATATGGRAFYSSNDLREALSEATEAGANFYTLSYASSNQNYDGQLRKIHVELSRHGYHLAYRRSYYANAAGPVENVSGTEPGTQSTAAKTVDSLTVHLRHGGPMEHQLFFGAHVQVIGTPAMATSEQMSTLAKQQDFSRVRGKNRPGKSMSPVPLQAYAIDYTLSEKQIKAGSRTLDTEPFLLELALAVFDDDGQMLISKVQHAREGASSGPLNAVKDGASVSGEKGKTVFYRFRQQIYAPLNAASIRIAVRDVSTDRVGAMEVALPLAPEPQAHADIPLQPRPANPDSTKPN
jgi:VWFA-related protein